MIASDEQAGAVVATCNAEGFPVAFVYTDGTPAAGREFSVRFANGDLLAVTKIEDDLYDKYGITAGGFPLLGGTGLLVAGAYPSGFDVTAVFPDGSEVLLVRAAGGDDFFAAWGALPCNESFFPLATPAAPSAPPATSLGSWSIEGDGTLLSFGDARGRFFGWICGQGDQDPVIYLELPGVAVAKSADGTVSFSFARANGTGGSVTWKFVGAGGWFVTDDVATNDLTVRLLPDVGSTSWNDLNVTVDGQGVVLTVDGDFRMVELYWQLTCVR